MRAVDITSSQSPCDFKSISYAYDLCQQHGLCRHEKATTSNDTLSLQLQANGMVQSHDAKS